MTFNGSVWVCARAANSKGTVSSVPTFGDESKQGENGPVA